MEAQLHSASICLFPSFVKPSSSMSRPNYWQPWPVEGGESSWISQSVHRGWKKKTRPTKKRIGECEDVERLVDGWDNNWCGQRIPGEGSAYACPALWSASVRSYNKTASLLRHTRTKTLLKTLLTLPESLMSFSFIRGVHLAAWGDGFVSVIGCGLGEMVSSWLCWIFFFYTFWLCLKPMRLKSKPMKKVSSCAAKEPAIWPIM